MRRIARLGFVPAALFAFACADAPASQELASDLERDLELASAVGLELAGQSGDQQIVSDVEVTPGTTVRRSPGPKPQRKGTPRPVAVPSVGDVATNDPVPALAEVPAVATDSAPAPTPEPVIAARPTPVQVSFPGETGTGGGGWGDGRGGGGVVVIRGGGTGIDHCERHPRPGSRTPVLINNRFPGRGMPGQPPQAPFPRTGSTFPRY